MARYKVIISISGGVAQIQECPPEVDVEIRDHDNCEVGEDPCVDCQEANQQK